MQIGFVGANCVRPPEIPVNLTGEHSSPLQKITTKLALKRKRQGDKKFPCLYFVSVLKLFLLWLTTPEN